MVNGQTGQSGQTATTHVVQEFQLAPEAAQIPSRNMVGTRVMEQIVKKGVVLKTGKYHLAQKRLAL